MVITLEEVEKRIAEIEGQLPNMLATFHKVSGLLEEAKYWREQLLKEAPVDGN